MILRRLAGAFRKQDWFTVALEVLIVVVGILIGLQVDDWNQHRKDRAEEIVYLDRLLRDVESSLDIQRASIENASSRHENTRLLVSVIDAGDLGDMTNDEFSDRLSNAWGFPAMTLMTATMDELVATGNITLLRSTRLREEIGQVLEQYENMERYYQNAVNVSLDATSRLYQHTRRIWLDENRVVISTPFAELIDNASFRAALDQQAHAFGAIRDDLREVHALTQKYHEVLKNTGDNP